MKNKISHFIEDKRGAGAIEQTIILLIFVALFCFTNDIILVAYKQYAISEVANKVTRRIAVQGGALASVPKNYQDADGEHYSTKQDIVDSLNEFLLGMDANIKKVSVINTKTNKRYELLNNGKASYPRIDYREKFHIIIEYEYEWSLVQNLFPTNPIQMHVDRFSVGEFNYDD